MFRSKVLILPNYIDFDRSRLQVVFYDDAPKEEIVLIHHRTNANTDTVLRCIEGNDSFIHGPQKLKNKKMKTCSITSVLYVQQNDTIEIQNKIAGTTIDLTKDATYFGAVLMSPLQLYLLRSQLLYLSLIKFLTQQRIGGQKTSLLIFISISII